MQFAILILLSALLATASAMENSARPCFSGLCPFGFSCSKEDNCEPLVAKRAVSGQSVGPCFSGFCPFGFSCSASDNCEPETKEKRAVRTEDAIGPCNAEGQCPVGFSCTKAICYRA